MRYVMLVILGGLMTAGTVSAGWIDIQRDSSMAFDVPAASECDTARSDFAGKSSDLLAYPDYRAIIGSESVAGDHANWIASPQSESGFPQSESEMFSDVLWPEESYGDLSHRDFFFGEDASVGDSQTFLTLGTVPFENDEAGKPYSPKRLKMPEPLSLVVWAFLGAAWAGLAWHRRPTHRAPQWPGDGVEEGTRWSTHDRQAILDVLKKNRD